MAASRDDLDDLLDSALDDFQNMDSLLRTRRQSESPPSEIPSATSNATIKESDTSTLGKGLGVSLPSLAPRAKKASKGGKASSSTKVGATNSNLSNTLEELAQQTRQTLEGMDSDEADKMVENMVKQFEQLGTNEDMQSLMETMMRQLFSKDVLHEPMKELVKTYPGWLEANKSKLSASEYNQYSRQYELMKDLCDVYETTPDDFHKIVDIMQQMQEYGQPPIDLVQELAPGAGTGEDLFPMFSELLQDNNGQQNCSIM